MFSWNHPPKTPIIVAHRGSSGHAPENTLAAFKRAIEDGAHAIELDIRLTRDGEIVVFHDSHLGRTTDGRGKLELSSLSRLKRLNAGSWFHPRFVAELIPTLDEVFDLIANRVGINIEIKSDRKRKKDTLIVDKLLSVIRRRHAGSSVMVSSFHHHYLTYLHDRDPRITLGFLFHPLKKIGRSPAKLTQRGGGNYIILSGSSCRKRFVEGAHKNGLRVGEYTVNSSRRFERSIRFGVDAIFTDVPAKIQDLPDPENKKALRRGLKQLFKK